MNIAKVHKAIAGGFAAAATTGSTAYFVLPEGLEVPSYVYLAVPVVNFIVGYAVVYFAPANKPT